MRIFISFCHPRTRGFTRCPRCSKSDRFLQNAVAHQVIEATFGHDPNAATKELLQFGDESAREPRAWRRSNVHEQIEVALWPGITGAPSSPESLTFEAG
jgi:hypothetical protein